MDHKTVEEYLLSLPNAKLDYPFGEGVAVYKVGDPSTRSGQAKMFALISEGTNPLRISLKCDPQLAVILREKYETVLEGYHLNKKHWNTVILTGQLPWEEVQGLIVHSYNLVSGEGDQEAPTLD
jgi:predicted DNA-binding protein (MmcQ/YjbR family)